MIEQILYNDLASCTWSVINPKRSHAHINCKINIGIEIMFHWWTHLKLSFFHFRGTAISFKGKVSGNLLRQAFSIRLNAYLPKTWMKWDQEIISVAYKLIFLVQKTTMKLSFPLLWKFNINFYFLFLIILCLISLVGFYWCWTSVTSTI